MRFRGVVVFAVFWLGSCAARFHVEGIVEHPAELPVRAFPPVAILSAADPDSTEVTALIARQLEAGGTAVGLGAGALQGAGIRIDVEVRFSPRAETRWSSRPENVCGPYGCYVRQVTFPYDVIFLVGDVVIRVSDPSTASLLAERTLEAEEIGSDSPARRAAIRHRIVAMVLAWFDARPERVATTLPRVGGDDYARAARLGREARWDEAVTAFRAVRDGASFARRSAEDRAGVLVALAIAIRFSAGARTSPSQSLGESISLVDESIGLVATDAARSLRVALVLQLEEARVLEVQRGAFGETANDALTVPEAYR